MMLQSSRKRMLLEDFALVGTAKRLPAMRTLQWAFLADRRNLPKGLEK